MIDIENCNDIEKLREICLYQRSQLSIVSDILVEESKWHITPDVAIKRIRTYLVDYKDWKI